MRVVEIESWRQFREMLYRYGQLPAARQRQWWFRGQPNFGDELIPTVDRVRRFRSDRDREQFIGDLLREYRKEAIGIGMGAKLPLGEGFELLARHHGLPSPLLDWTRSPYIATCFAFMDCDPAECDSVGIFALDRRLIPPRVLDPEERALEFIENPELLVSNRRAVQQRGIFMRRSTIRDSVENLLGEALFKFKIPMRERDEALADLDQAMVNPTSLFYDLDGAALTVTWRCCNINPGGVR